MRVLSTEYRIGIGPYMGIMIGIVATPPPHVGGGAPSKRGVEVGVVHELISVLVHIRGH